VKNYGQSAEWGEANIKPAESDTIFTIFIIDYCEVSIYEEDDKILDIACEGYKQFEDIMHFFQC
jgi:hypothetical protein